MKSPYRKYNLPLKHITISFVLCGLVACQKKTTLVPEYKDIQPVDEVLKVQKQSESSSPLPQVALSACEYWESIASEDAGDFQIVDSLGVNDEGRLIGRYSPSLLPQVRFRLSTEFAEMKKGSSQPVDKSNESLAQQSEELKKVLNSYELERKSLPIPVVSSPKMQSSLSEKQKRAQIVAEKIRFLKTHIRNTDEAIRICKAAESLPNTGPKDIDPPTLEKFNMMVKCDRLKGNVSSLQWYVLQILGDKFKLSKRNAIVQEKVEEQLPGVFSGNVGLIAKTNFVEEFLKSVSWDEQKAIQGIDQLAPLSAKVKLFVSNRWEDRRKDLLLAFTVLKYGFRADLSVHEQACRYGILQRYMGQFLALKGTHGAVSLNAGGLLREAPLDPLDPIAELDVPGVLFNAVISKDWVEQELIQLQSKPLGVAHNQDFFDVLRYVNLIASERSSKIYHDGGAVPTKDTQLYRLDPTKTLPIGFGSFAILCELLKRDYLIRSGTRIALSGDNSPKALAKLMRSIVEIAANLSSLNFIGPVESASLSSEQVRKLQNALLETNRLLTGLSLEGLERMRQGQGSEELRWSLREVGVYLENKKLQSL